MNQSDYFGKTLKPWPVFVDHYNWDFTSLGNVVDIIGGGTPETTNPKYWDGSIDWYSPTEIGLQVYVYGSLQKITELGLKKSSAKILPADRTILFTSRAGIGDMAILKKAAATNQGFQSFVVNDIDVYFLYSMGFKIKKFALGRASGSTFLEISKNQLGLMEFLSPDFLEQTKIGTFFQQLDKTIALQEQKYSQTKNIKKAMLQKMFPKEGSKQPEIRFKGFGGDWDKYRLEDIANVFDGTHQTPKYTDSGVMFLSVENIKTLFSEKFISKEDFDRDFKIYPQKNDVLMTRIGDVGTANVVTTEELLAYYVSLALIKPVNINPFFLSVALSSDLVQQDIWRRTLHIAFPKKINKNQICQVELLAPISVKEQEKIGNYFKQLDDTIALQAEQLAKLKNIKQAYLNSMFV